MNTSEKRLFKLKSSTYKRDDKSSQLFDLYVGAKNLEDLDKEAAKKIKTKRITKLHSELYQQLQVFFADEELKSDKKYQYYQKIFAAKNFLKRKLYIQADQIIEKVLKDLFHYEIYEIALEALSVKLEISLHVSNLKGSETYREKLLGELELTMERLHSVYSRFFVYSKLIDEHDIKGPARNKEELDYYKKITSRVNLDEGEGFRIRRNNIVIKSEFQTLAQDEDGLVESRKSLVDLYGEYEHMLKFYLIDFTIAHYNLAGELIERDEMEAAERILGKMELLFQKYKEIDFLKMEFLVLSLEYAIRKKDKAKSLELANTMIELKDKDGKVIYGNYAAVKIVIAYFLSNEYQMALDSINLALDNRIKTQRKDCYSLLLIYEIFIYAQLDWNEMAESKLLGLIRYMKLHYNKERFENWCVGFLRKLIREDKTKYKSIIENALKEIEEIAKEDLSEHILGVGEFKIWLEHELSRTSI